MEFWKKKKKYYHSLQPKSNIQKSIVSREDLNPVTSDQRSSSDRIRNRCVGLYGHWAI